MELKISNFAPSLLRIIISKAANWAGSKTSVVISFLTILFYLIAGFFFGFTENYNILWNTYFSVVSFIMLFVLQYSTRSGEAAIHIKLDELIHSSKANNDIIHIECLTEEELEKLSKKYMELAKQHKLNKIT